jgi:hypothetical protein
MNPRRRRRRRNVRSNAREARRAARELLAWNAFSEHVAESFLRVLERESRLLECVLLAKSKSRAT